MIRLRSPEVNRRYQSVGRKVTDRNLTGRNEPPVGRRKLMIPYVLGGMILASVGYGLYKLLFGSKEEQWGEPQSFLLRR